MAFKESRRSTLLQSAIPVVRGPAKHIEHDDDTAKTAFSPSGQVMEIHTPQATLQRIHEVMHAQHTNINQYKGIRKDVVEIVEDCRLHLTKWPWPKGSTPVEIYDNVHKSLAEETSAAKKLGEKLPKWNKFAIALRASAVSKGTLNPDGDKYLGGFISQSHKYLAHTIHNEITAGRHLKAARMLEKMFFMDDEEHKEKEEERKRKAERFKSRSRGGIEKPSSEKERDEIESEREAAEEERLAKEYEKRYGEYKKADMEIVELPLVTPVLNETEGFRLTVSGLRIYRPALRRPVLPQRIFIKRAPVEPGGVIVFDASSSMDVTTSVLVECCKRSPMATVAFYSGPDGGGKGYLWVFAQGGVRADNIDGVRINSGNLVDHHAIDWMLKHDRPRIMVTDRRFTCPDAYVHMIRLSNLEEEGEVEVYPSYREFMSAFKIHEDAA